MKVNLNTIKNWFKTDLKPNQTQFWNLLDSFWHKDESIPIDTIEDLTSILQQKADGQALGGHLTDTEAHAALFSALDTLIQTNVDKITELQKGPIRIGDYMVDRRGGTDTTIKAGNIITGKGLLFDQECIVAIALVDDAATESQFKIISSGI